MTARRYRVVQWATGNIGLRALRGVIRHPDLDLVGVLVYDPAKDGVDAGTLCGEPPTGITATTDKNAIRALKADCVLYMARALDLDDVVGLLESGTNVVTTRGELFGAGQPLGPEGRQRVLDACARGGTSIFATGSSPGFITDTLPLALISLQRHVEGIEVNEYADLSQRNSPHLLFELMGFGQPLESYNPARAEFLKGEFAPSFGVVARAAGLDVDTWTAQGDVAAARRTTMLAAGELPAGTVAAQRNAIIGSVGGREAIRFTTYWYCTADIDTDWELLPTGWKVRTRGDAPLDVTLRFPFAVEELGDATPSYTANRPVNAVPHVCAARPGILSVTDLPPLVPVPLDPV